jgi:Gly-Xaa carboxypeptidase
MAGIESKFGTEFALPATSEKGYLDVTMRIESHGGLSQEPPEHTTSQSPFRVVEEVG